MQFRNCRQRSQMWLLWWGVALSAVFSPSTSILAEDSSSKAEFFEMRIRPILSEHCYTCHTNLQMGGLQIDSRERLLKGGNSGPAVVPGKPEESLLIQAVTHSHARIKMPPQGKLNDQQIADLTDWVKMGTPWPESPSALSTVSQTKGETTPARSRFWAFQPIQKPTLPTVKGKFVIKSPIDRFILSRLESEGLQPVKAATKQALLRRATYDLIGLPPKPEEVDAFLRDSSPQAFARVVDRLLASPHYGERWGRYWLDVARYGEDDSHGFGGSHVNAFRYRDWVIQAFNDDMPYDLFVKAQIAADLLEGKDRKELMAGLGLFGIGPRFQVVEPIKAKAEECNDRVDTLTRGFLGLTVACARCHDHKYDPITVKDYYGMIGVFASSEYREFPIVHEDIVKEWQEQEKKIKDQEGAIKEFIQIQSTQLSEILASKTAKYMVAAWQVLANPKENRERAAMKDQLDLETLERWVKYLETKDREHPYLQAWDALSTQAATIDTVKTVAREFQDLVISVLKEKRTIDDKNRITLAQAKDEGYCKECSVSLLSLERDKFVLWRDLFDDKRRNDDQAWTEGGVLLYQGDKIDRFLSGDWRGHLDWMRAELNALKKALPPQYPYLHTITESAKPTNVRVNIRGNPENLGEEVPRRFLAVLSDGMPVPFAKGSGRLELARAVANHPLAARVMVNRIWQHHFGRGIVSTPSNFGQLGEQPSHPALLEYLASRFIEDHWSIKALHREIMLTSTYQLSSDYSKQNFTVDPDNRLLWRANRRRLDAEALIDSILFVSGNLDMTVGGPSAELSKDFRRRTVYSKISRHKRDVLLGMFDFPDPSISSEKRNSTIVPLQQLFFLNSELMFIQAEALAKRLQDNSSTDTVRIHKAYRLLFGREATGVEVSLGLDFIRESQTESANSSLAWQRYTHALLTSNEFCFVD